MSTGAVVDKDDFHPTILIGNGAGASISDLNAAEAVIIGKEAGANYAGTQQRQSVAVGPFCLTNAKGIRNTCLGYSSGSQIEGGGGKNTSVGAKSMGNSTAGTPSDPAEGTNNTAIGYRSLASIRGDSSHNIYVGCDESGGLIVDKSNMISLGRDIDASSLASGAMTIGNSSHQVAATINAGTSIALKIGSASALSITSSAITTTGLLLDSNGHSAAGHGNSYHVSGAGSSEIRSVLIHPCNVETDSGTASLMVDHNSGGTSIADPATSASARRRFTLGCRPEASSMQMYFPIDNIPSGWKGTAILVYITQGDTNAQMNVRIAVASRKIINIGQGGATANYVTSHLALSNSNTSNALRTFSTAFTPDGSTNCYLYVASQSEHTIVTGGYVQIERV